MIISHKQASSFAYLIKDIISPYIEQNKALYIDYLTSIKDTDKEAENELKALLNELQDNKEQTKH